MYLKLFVAKAQYVEENTAPGKQILFCSWNFLDDVKIRFTFWAGFMSKIVVGGGKGNITLQNRQFSPQILWKAELWFVLEFKNFGITSRGNKIR